MVSGFEVVAAKSKKERDDAPTQVPMSRSQAGGVRRNPSTDQKKVRHQQTRKTASTDSATLERIQSRDPDGGSTQPTEDDYLNFESWVKGTFGETAWNDYKGWGVSEDTPYDPSADDPSNNFGGWGDDDDMHYGDATASRVTAAHQCVYDGVVDPMTGSPIDHHSDDLFEVYSGNPEPTYICGYHEQRFSVPGSSKSPLPSNAPWANKSAVLFKLAGPDSYDVKRAGIGEWESAGTTYEEAVAKGMGLRDTAQSSTLVLIRNNFNGSITVFEYPSGPAGPLSEPMNRGGYERFYGRPYGAAKLASDPVIGTCPQCGRDRYNVKTGVCSECGHKKSAATVPCPACGSPANEFIAYGTDDSEQYVCQVCGTRSAVGGLGLVAYTLGEPQHTTCPKCGSAQMFAKSGYCPQCGYRRGVNQNKESSMNVMQREADLLRAMAVADLDEQRKLSAELEQLRADARGRVAADRETDLADTYIRDVLTPVVAHSMHTAATDWVDDIAEDEPEFDENEMLTEATLWFGRTSAEVRADREEFAEQAQGYARLVASKFGTNARPAAYTFLNYVGRLHKLAEEEAANAVSELPAQVPVEGYGDVLDNFAPPETPANASIPEDAEFSTKAPVVSENEQEAPETGDQDGNAGDIADPSGQGVSSLPNVNSSRIFLAHDDHRFDDEMLFAVEDSREGRGGESRSVSTSRVSGNASGLSRNADAGLHRTAADARDYDEHHSYDNDHLDAPDPNGPNATGNGNANSSLPKEPTGKSVDDTMFPWEEEMEAANPSGAAAVAGVPTPGQGVADYPQPKQSYKSGTCPRCGGSGKDSGKQCIRCHGKGKVNDLAEASRRTAIFENRSDVPRQCLGCGGMVPPGYGHRHQAAEGQTCSTCGAAIERDPEGEPNRSWHHNDGATHDHEAKPSGDSKEAAGLDNFGDAKAKPFGAKDDDDEDDDTKKKEGLLTDTQLAFRARVQSALQSK